MKNILAPRVLHFLRKRPALFIFWSLLTLFCSTALHLPSGITQEASADFAVLKEIMIKGNVISVKTDKPVSYNVFKVGSPSRLVLELTQTENDWKQKDVTLKNNAFFSRVRAAQFQNDPVKIARVVIDVKSGVEYQTSANGNTILLTAQKSGQPASRAQSEGNSSAQTSKKPETGQEDPDPSPAAAAPTPAELAKTDPQTTPAAAQNPTPTETQSQPVGKKPAKESLKDSTEPTSLFGRQLVTLDFYDIDIKDLFKILSEKSGVNIVYGSNVSGTVSIQLRDVPFKDAVDTILALKGLKMVVLGKNILQLMTPQEFDAYKISAISTTKVFPINYAKATEVETQLKAILATLGGKGKTLVDDRTNAIIVTDTPEGIQTIARLIDDLDKPTPQVMIEAKIVQITLGKSLDLGITWGAAYTDQSGNQMITIGASKDVTGTQNAAGGTVPGSGGSVQAGNSIGDRASGLQGRSALNPSGGSGLELGGAGFNAAQGLGLSFGFVKDVVRLNAALSALQQKNKSKVLSNPKIATINNQAAVIKTEVNEPYITTDISQTPQAGSLASTKVNFVKSGISLTVTPTINKDGRITMNIIPDITSSQPTSIGIPKTTSQNVRTIVVVRDGETFVIGGLITELESDGQAYIPILGSIPILGHLFKKTSISKTRAELLVFVTPKIIPY